MTVKVKSSSSIEAGPAQRAPFLDASSVSKSYGSHLALDSVDLKVDAGEIHCIAGENGSGKSTLIKVLSGVVRPDPGARLTIGAATQASLRVAESRRLGIQVIHQHLSLFPNLTVAENIAIDTLRQFGLTPISAKSALRTAEQAMARIAADLDPTALVGELPVAQRQLVAICRALAAECRLIFMDEPTASLAHREVERLLKVISELSAEGIGTVFVSHRLREVIEVAEAVTVLRDGRKVGRFEASGMTEKRLAELMTGASYDYSVRPAKPEAGVLLSVQDLSRQAEFESVSFHVRRGEIVGLIGRTGSGRTELGLALFGITRPDSGVMALAGKPYRPRSNRQAIDRGLCYLSEDRMSTGLVLNQSISRNMTLSVLKRLSSPAGVVRRDEVSRLVDDLVARLGIKARRVSDNVNTLSGGNQQRVAIAKWVAAEPQVLILDSPTVGVDIKAKDAIYGIIDRLAAAGVAIIVISDEVDEVYHHCDRVLVMLGGSLRAEFVPSRCGRQEIEHAVYD